MKRFMLSLLSVLCVQAAIAAPSTSTSKQPYLLGVFPYTAPRQIIEFFGPAAASMETAIGHPVKLESAANFAEFEQNLKARKYDIVFIQPFDFPLVVDKLGYIPIARQNSPLITQIMVKEDSTLTSLAELRNQILALPPEPSANARMSLRALRDNGLKPNQDVNIRYFQSHDSCLQQVLAGEAAACGTSLVPLRVFEQRMQVKMRSIFDAKPIPHVMFAVQSKIPPNQRKALQQQILDWGKSDAGRAILEKIGPPGYVIPDLAEYAVMRNYDKSSNAKAAAPTVSSELLLGVFPFLNTRQIAQNYAPVVPAFSKATGLQVHLRTSTDFATFSSALKSSTFDVVLVQPFDYPHAVEYGYQPLAMMKDSIQGTFLVRKDSAYQAIGDFKGKTIAMPPEGSAQSRLGRHTLLQSGLMPGKDVTIRYLKTHDACLQQVNLGEAEACTTAEITLAMLPKELSQNLRSIGKTIQIPGVLFMAHKRLPSSIGNKIQNEILTWKDTPEQRAILNGIGFGEFVKVNTEEYQSMPRLE